MRVCLLVDGSDIIRKVSRHIVEQLGYLVVEADDAQTALNICEKEAPELVLLDWQPPGMTSHEFLQALKERTTENFPRIIYCVTENDPVDMAQAFSAGISDYILKPIDRASLHAKINEVCAAA